jgi:anti-sigma B factor antagonist
MGSTALDSESGHLREPPVQAVDRRGASAVVKLVGELDLYNVDDVRSALLDCIEDGAARVVADLSGVTFVDSTVLGAFLEARARGELVLAALRPEPKRALEITGLDRTLKLADSVDEAVT